MLKDGRLYPSDLSDKQWKLICNFIPKATTTIGRPRTTEVRQVLNAVFYINRTGCAWRYLPKEYPPWPTVYDYYVRWVKFGVLRQIHDHLASLVRLKENKQALPSVVIIDSQSAKAHFGEHLGFDGFKKVRGRKRHILVDTMGLVHDLRVTSASSTDSPPAIEMLEPSSNRLIKLKALYVDGGYRGGFERQVFYRFGIRPTLKKTTHVIDRHGSRSLTQSNLKPTRWIVERTFAWFNHFRRLSRDYERKIKFSESMIYLSMTQLMLTRLFKNYQQSQHRWKTTQ